MISYRWCYCQIYSDNFGRKLRGGIPHTTLGAVHKLIRHLGGGGVNQLLTSRGLVLGGCFIAKKLKLSTWGDGAKISEKCLRSLWMAHYLTPSVALLDNHQACLYPQRELLYPRICSAIFCPLFLCPQYSCHISLPMEIV